MKTKFWVVAVSAFQLTGALHFALALPCSEMPSFTYLQSGATSTISRLKAKFSFPNALRFADCSEHLGRFSADSSKPIFTGSLIVPKKRGHYKSFRVAFDSRHISFRSTVDLDVNDLASLGLSSSTHKYSFHITSRSDPENGNIWHTWEVVLAGDVEQSDYIIHKAVIPASRPGGYQVLTLEKYRIHIERNNTFDGLQTDSTSNATVGMLGSLGAFD